MTAWLPFEEAFWRTDEERKKIAKENDQKPEKLEMRERPAIKEPAGVKGFIVAMPWRWTAGENNDSGVNKLIIAFLDSLEGSGSDGAKTYVADAGKPGGGGTSKGSSA